MPPPPPTPTKRYASPHQHRKRSILRVQHRYRQFHTNKAGASVSLIPAIQNNGIYQTQNVDFVHLNASSAPIVTAMVPQDVYPSVLLTYTYTQFTYVSLNPNGGVEVTSDSVGEANAVPFAPTVDLPSPIAVSGPAMGLLLNLQQSASATLNRHR